MILTSSNTKLTCCALLELFKAFIANQAMRFLTLFIVMYSFLVQVISHAINRYLIIPYSQIQNSQIIQYAHTYFWNYFPKPQPPNSIFFRILNMRRNTTIKSFWLICGEFQWIHHCPISALSINFQTIIIPTILVIWSHNMPEILQLTTCEKA